MEETREGKLTKLNELMEKFEFANEKLNKLSEIEKSQELESAQEAIEK